MSETDGEPDRSDRLHFSGGVRWLAAVVVLGGIVISASRYANDVLELGPAVPVVDSRLVSVLFSLVLLGIAVAALRAEGVGLAEVGLAPRLFGPAAAAVAGYFLALNVAGAVIAAAAGVDGAIGYQWTVPPAEAAFVFAFMFVVAGVVEEVLFRGYLQNKLIAALRGSRRVRVAGGILLASALFSLSHVPRVLTAGAPTMDATGYLALLFVNGIGFGLLYEFTHNLSVPILVHAAGNMPGTAGILFLDVGMLLGWALALYFAAYLGFAVLTVVTYRRWAYGAGAMPVWTERRAIDRAPEAGS